MSRIYKAYLVSEVALKRFLWRFYKRAEDVEDAAQEAFLRAFRAEFDQEIDDPQAFLFRVARNFALSDLARKSNNAVVFLAESGGSPVLEDESLVCAEEQLVSKQKLALLVRAVATLPPKCRRIFIMRKFEGRRVKDIAAILGVSVSNVDNQLAVGLQRCTEYLRKHGYGAVDGMKHSKTKRYWGARKSALGKAND